MIQKYGRTRPAAKAIKAPFPREYTHSVPMMQLSLVSAVKTVRCTSTAICCKRGRWSSSNWRGAPIHPYPSELSRERARLSYPDPLTSAIEFGGFFSCIPTHLLPDTPAGSRRMVRTHRCRLAIAMEAARAKRRCRYPAVSIDSCRQQASWLRFAAGDLAASPARHPRPMHSSCS